MIYNGEGKVDIIGIVIKSVDYGDKDKLISIAAPDGIYLVKAKGVRSASSKLKGFVGVLNFGEFSLVAGKNGYTLSGAEITEGFYNCWGNPEKYAAAMSCLDIFEKCSRAGEPLGIVNLLKSLKTINYGQFYPLAEGLRYGVLCAVDTGIDVTEKVFPDEVCAVFSAILKSASAEEVLTDYSREDIKLFFRHLAVGFYSELGIKLNVFLD